MSSFDIVSMALRNLFKRKLRTFLTVLGVVVGCTSVVTMISLGLGINRSIEEQMKYMGDLTKIEIYNGAGYYGWEKDALVIDADFMKKIEAVEGIQAASPFLQTYITATSGRYRVDLQIYGMNPAAMEAFGYVAESGRLLNDGDAGMQIVFGSDVPYNFTNPRDRNRGGGMYYRSSSLGMVVMDSSLGGMGGREAPKVNVLEDRIQASFAQGFGDPNYQPDPNTQGREVKPYKFDGVGVLAPDPQNWETQYYSFMNIEAVETIIAERQKYEKAMWGGSGQETYGYERVQIKAVDVMTVDKVINALVELGVNRNTIYNARDSVKDMQDMLGSLQGVLGAIGAVSLFVAAIGIANTMVMSIYERTREIGIMKVIGASIRDIRRLFLTEAAVIGVIGGIFGVGLSLFVSFIINDVGIRFFDMFASGGQDISYMPVWLCAGALAFSAMIGLLSGYFPAQRATQLSALTAIRSE